MSYLKRKSLIILHFNCFLPFLFIVEIVFSCVSFSVAASPSLIWNNDTIYPIAVTSSVALTGQDHCIYVFGGWNNNSTVFSNSYKFNATAGFPREWTEIASMPTAVYRAAGCVANDGRFFIFAGTNLQIYNATANIWNNSTLNIPSEASIYYSSCAVDSSTGLMYITGGYNNPAFFYSYDTNTSAFTNLSISSPNPFNLFGQGSFVVNNKLYVFGGYNFTAYSASTYIYDIGNSTWSIGTNMMMQAMASFGYATDGSRFYVIGGYDNFPQYNTQVFDISSGVWTVNDGIVLTGGIYDNAAVFLDGSLHTIGATFEADNYVSVHRIASLCGVYSFSGPCDNENQCTFNDTCQSNGTCIGKSENCSFDSTCDPSTGQCVRNSSSSSSTTTSSSSTTTSSSSRSYISISISISVSAFTGILLVFLIELA